MRNATLILLVLLSLGFAAPLAVADGAEESCTRPIMVTECPEGGYRVWSCQTEILDACAWRP